MWSGMVSEHVSMPRTKASRRHLALFFPFLSADRATAARAAPAEAPFACIAPKGGALHLAALDPRAGALGLVPGMTLADARARVPELEAVPHDPDADRRLLRRLASGCGRYTPMAAMDAPDALILDISGCAHLFGGETALAADAEARMARQGFACRAALAGTPEAALALARFRTWPAGCEPADLHRLPVAALRLEPAAEAALRRAGLHTIGDLARRPTAPLSARFGKEAAATLDRLLGRADSRITPLRPPPALRFVRRFAEPIAYVEQALAAMTELAGEARRAMEARGAGGRRFVAHFFRSDGAVRALAVRTGLPTRDPALLDRLLREKLAGIADPLDPGFGFDSIALHVPDLEPMAPAQPEMDGRGGTGDGLARLIERLSARLGRGRIRRFLPVDSHVPERRARAVPALDAAAPAAWSADNPDRRPDEPPARPIHLLEPPDPVEVMAEVPDGPPLRFRWRRALHEVTRHEGPERIAPLWWEAGGDARPTRDYYRVEDQDGRRFWIFRDGLYSERTAPRWYMHGLFA